MKAEVPQDTNTVQPAFTQQPVTAYGSTVGYGDKYPKHTGDNLVVEQNNRACGIHHATRDLEYGFDYTHFGNCQAGVENFTTILKNAGLDPIADFTRVYRDLGRGTNTDYPDHWLYTWANEDILIGTIANPINGDPGSKKKRGEIGYTSAIGVGGKAAAVENVVKEINSTAMKIKGQNEGILFA